MEITNRVRGRVASVFRTYTGLKLAGILAVVLLASAGVLVGSSQSLPGSPFFAFKRSVEAARMALAPSADSRARLEDEFDDRRVQEVQAITQARISVPVDFGGMLQISGGDRWLVNGIVVRVPATANIVGQPQPGIYLYIHGSSLPDGEVQADLVEVEGVIFQGRLNAITAGSWQVDFMTVYMSEESQVEGNPMPGDVVEVNAMVLSDGSFMAEHIRVALRQSPMN